MLYIFVSSLAAKIVGIHNVLRPKSTKKKEFRHMQNEHSRNKCQKRTKTDG